MMRRIILFILIIAAITFSLSAQTQQQQIKILGVAVKGNKTISENSIKVQSGLIEGKEIAREDISTAIKQLWQLKLFSDIKVYYDQATQEGVFLIIEVSEYPRMGQLQLDGNKKLSDSKINDEIYALPGKVLSPHFIYECKRKIKALYRKDGYLLAEVEAELKEGKGENTKHLVLHIDENKKVRVGEIEFVGNEKFSDRKLERTFKETRERNLFLFRLGEFDREKYQEDKDKLRTFYRSEGYRDFEILYDSIAYSENKKRMQIELGVYEGPRYKYGDITLSGNTLFSDDQLMALLGVKAGEWYNEEEFNKGLYERINGLYMDRGYLYFQAQPQEIPVGENKVDMNIQIVENNQVKVNLVNIIGNDKTHENVIRRELKIFPGDIFSREALMRSQREIFILNYFSDVQPDIVPVSDDQIDVEVSVEEKSADRANFSVSISQMHGLIGGGGLEFNNFRGRGQQLKISYQQGARYSIAGTGATPYKSFSFGFTDPWVFDTPNLVGFNLYYSEKGGRGYYYYPFDLNMRGGSLRLGRRFRWPDNYFSGTWSINYAKKEYQNIDEDYLNDVLMGRPHTTGISLTQIVSRDSRDRPEFPTMGSVLRWEATLSGGFLGGTEDFQKHKFTLEYYVPTIWKLVLYNHVEFGVIQPFKKNSVIPPDERFIMGGAGMIYGVALRGYDDNQVGPTYTQTSRYRPYGGQSLFKYTLEYRVPISENPTIYGLAFAEAGNIWKTLSSTDPFNLKRSAGVGVRFFMPQIGMIGVDFGYGFDDIDRVGDPGYGKPEGWKTHFIFGMPF